MRLPAPAPYSNMALKIYNTLTRKKEAFKPVKDNFVRMYTCGPTVYDYAHIGNFRAFLFEDILRRYLKFKGFKVKQVMNLTDVDDKIIKRMKAEGKSLKEVTSRMNMPKNRHKILPCGNSGILMT